MTSVVPDNPKVPTTDIPSLLCLCGGGRWTNGEAVDKPCPRCNRTRSGLLSPSSMPVTMMPDE
jgi:hypothetical protein